MNSDSGILVQRILDEISVIYAAVDGIDEERFSQDEVLQHAVVMALLNSGELAKNVDTDIKEKYRTIPWKRIIGLRNVAAHGSAALSMADIWKTINEDIPVLEIELRELLKNEAWQ